jgi:hypothetical protein
VILQLTAIAATFLLTYIFFQAIGQRSRSLFFSRQQKTEWDADIKRGLGDWLVVTSIFGTLTSFATYLFLVGSVKLFGWFALSTGITIILSAPVTIALTRPLLKDDRIKRLLVHNDQVASVISSLFWSNDKTGRATSRIIQRISLAVLLSIIWLECTAFVDLSFWLAGQPHAVDPEALLWRFATLFGVAFLILYFVLRYGIRGFVFADLLHSPIIGVVALTLLGGAVYLIWGQLSTFDDYVELTTPLLSEPVFGIPFASGWIFASHVLVLNLFQIVCTEHHWFRMWLLGEKELKRQPTGTVVTGAIWLVMLPIGFIAFAVAGQPGEAAVAGLLAQLQGVSAAFILLFWIGATAALFSTVDMQIYSTLLVSRFNPENGELKRTEMTFLRSLVWSVGLALFFALAYVGVRAAALPLEKIIFVVVPLCTVLLPAFVHYALGRSVQPWVLLLSFLGYVAIAGLGFILPQYNFAATLSAVFVPVIVTILTLPLTRRRT